MVLIVNSICLNNSINRFGFVTVMQSVSREVPTGFVYIAELCICPYSVLVLRWVLTIDSDYLLS
jgi:hypothetical protein